MSIKQKEKQRKRKKGREGGETSVGEEEVEKLEPSYIAGGDIKWLSHYGKQFGDSSKN